MSRMSFAVPPMAELSARGQSCAFAVSSKDVYMRHVSMKKWRS
jgi:hypothetical protein